MAQKNNLLRSLKLKLLQIAKKTQSRHVHIGSCLSCFEILYETLVFQMRPQDKLILSKGHAALTLYVILNYQKKISDRILKSYLQDGSLLGIHPSSAFPHDIPLATGSLGHGLSFACGLAKGYLLQKKQVTPRVYCLISDGECNEGSIWEAALFAAQHKLENLIVIIDKNNLQAYDCTKNVLGEAAASDKWQAFGFRVLKTDGHDQRQLEKRFLKLHQLKDERPKVLICNTKRGKGLSSVENKVQSNYIIVGDSHIQEFIINKN